LTERMTMQSGSNFF